MRLFGTAGIRFRYPNEIDPVMVYKLGLTLGSLGISDRSFVVYDSRFTNHLFTYSFSSGLMASGVDAYVVGLAPTPVAAHCAREFKGLGVSVTASHNPPEYNGFKFYDKEGFEFTRDLEELVEKRFVEEFKPMEWRYVGKLYEASILLENYVKSLIETLSPARRVWNPCVVIDVANGAAVYVTPRVVREIGCVPVTINANPDGSFPTRPPEPRKDVLEDYVNTFSNLNPAAILAHDGDADRLAVVDVKRGFIKQDRLIALYMSTILDERRGVVVVSVDTGKAIDDVAEKYGVKVERYVLGKIHERIKQIGLNNVALGAEPWKLIDPRWGGWVDGVWQAALVTKLIVERGKTIGEILDEEGISDYPWFRYSYIIEPQGVMVEVYGELLEELKSTLGEPVDVVGIDGYRFEYGDGSWILVRLSGTEPKIRVYGEALSRDRCEYMSSTFEAKLIDLVKKRNGRVVTKTVG